MARMSHLMSAFPIFSLCNIYLGTAQFQQVHSCLLLTHVYRSFSSFFIAVYYVESSLEMTDGRIKMNLKWWRVAAEQKAAGTSRSWLA